MKMRCAHCAGELQDQDVKIVKGWVEPYTCKHCGKDNRGGLSPKSQAIALAIVLPGILVGTWFWAAPPTAISPFYPPPPAEIGAD